jgi:hypothetical protein
MSKANGMLNCAINPDQSRYGLAIRMTGSSSGISLVPRWCAQSRDATLS